MCTFYFIEYIFERKDICVTLMAISMFIWMMALQFFVFYAQFMYFVAADNLDTSDSKENIAPLSAAGVGVDSVFESRFEAGRHLDKPKIIEQYLLSKLKIISEKIKEKSNITIGSNLLFPCKNLTIASPLKKNSIIVK